MDKILNAFSDFGLSVSSPIVDGNIHRCNSSGGGKSKRNLNGWYSVKEHQNKFYAVYGCWHRGESGRVSSDGESGLKNNSEVWALLAELQKVETEKVRLEGIEISSAFLSQCEPSTGDHEYLIRKKILPCGIYQHGDLLAVPIFWTDGTITSYQTITETGTKKMMTGGACGGGCYPIPFEGFSKVVCICEGFATGASIAQATEYKVLVALNAGNMKKVAKTAINKFPDSTILICADNDYTKNPNNGLIIAKKIALDLGLSCVWPTGIVGSDFNDMACEQSLADVKAEISQLETIEVLTAEDCIGEDLSLQIPDAAIPEGLISQGLEALEGDILQYSLPLVLTVISRAIAGKISLNGVYPNVFNIKVGGTSTGKTATDRKFLRCLDIDDFISLNDIASGAGLWRAIAENPQGMGFFDEVTSLFQRNNNHGGVDIVAESKSSALLDVFSRSGESFKKGFGDAKNSLDIHNPCFSLLGNATPTIFEAIQLKDFDTGLMQRFDFWQYDGKIKPKPLLIGSKYFEKTKKFVDELRKRVQFMAPESTLAALIRGCVELETTPQALLYIQEYSEYVTTEANKAQSDGLVGFMSRRFDLCLKYALIHHAATNKACDLLSKVTADDIQHGILIAEMLGGWKTHVLYDKVVSGDFHKDCEIFKAAIKAAIKSGKDKPTFKLLATRRAQLKNWMPKYSECVIGILKKRGEIITKEGRRNTQYYLPK